MEESETMNTQGQQDPTFLEDMATLWRQVTDSQVRYWCANLMLLLFMFFDIEHDIPASNAVFISAMCIILALWKNDPHRIPRKPFEGETR